MADSLLTGRALVEELKRLDIGVWTPDAVRQWIREEPPCPIAAPAQQGAPHRYALQPVLLWLKGRTARERGKGFTSQGGELARKIERELSRATGAGAAAEVAPVAPAVVPALQPALFHTEPAAIVAPAKGEVGFTDEEIAESNDLELMRKVLRGRDPRNWESAERALRLHRENRLAEGQVIPVEDLENTLATQAIAMRNACGAAVAVIAQRIPDASSYGERCQIIRKAMDDLLNRLAKEDTVALAGESTQ